MQYTLKERKEKEYESVIEISGLTAEITPDDLLDHLEKTQKILKEQRAQVKVNEQLNEKALEICPQLKDIPLEQLGVALSYFGKIAANQQSEAIIAECENTVTTYETHLKEVEKVMDLKILPEVSPFNPILETKTDE